MKFSRILILSATIAIGGSGAASLGLAQNQPTPEALQAALTLASLQSASMASNLTNGLIAQAWPTLEASVRARAPQVDPATIADLQREFQRTQTEYLNEILGEASLIYARYFTADELRQIVAFYQTPVGAKMLNVTPQLLSGLLSRELPRMQSKQQQVMQAFDQILRARGYIR